MLLLSTLLSQVILALCQCQCEERREYYSSYTSTQPGYEYNPYSPTGYSYNYGTCAQPTYETSVVNAVIYPYPVPIVYESPKEETPCSCGRKYTESRPNTETRYRYEDDDREYSSCRCTYTSLESGRTYPEERGYDRKCNCRQSEEYRRDDRYYDTRSDYEKSDCGCSKVKCVCVCDGGDYRDEDWDRRPRYEERGCRQRDVVRRARDCGCGRQNKQN